MAFRTVLTVDLLADLRMVTVLMPVELTEQMEEMEVTSPHSWEPWPLTEIKRELAEEAPGVRGSGERRTR